MKFLVIQHLAIESFGIFNPLCHKQGIALDVVQLEKGDAFPNPQSYDAIWVMGGPMNVDQEAKYPWLAAEKALIREAVAQGKPYVGICLGAQLLADALGGEVGPMNAPEVGVLPVTLKSDAQHPLLKGLASTFAAVQWHGYEVKQLPPGGVALATSAACPIQAFAVGETALGLQFHPEVTDWVMESWLSVPAYCAELEGTLGASGCSVMRDGVLTHLAELETTAHTLFENFLAGVRSPQQNPSLPLF